MVATFKQKHTLEQRVAESNRVMKNYPDRLPIICEKSNKAKMSEIDKTKYLVPSDLTVGQFIFVIRRRLSLTAEEAIYLFIDGIIPPSAELMSNLYDRKKDVDGFLYILYANENTFGSIDKL